MSETGLSLSLDSFFLWLLHTSWQTAILVGVVLAAQRLFRDYLTAHWRYALWLLVLLRMLMPTGPESRFSLFSVVPGPRGFLSAEAVPPVEEHLPLVTPLTPTTQVGPPAPSTASEKQHETTGAGQAVASVSSSSVSTSSTSTSTSTDWMIYLSFIWLFGAVVLLVCILVRGVAGLIWSRHYPAFKNSEAQLLLEACAREVGVRKTIRLVAGPKEYCPALYGIKNPMLLLHSELEETIGLNNLRYVFLHELAHVKRHDIFVKWIANLLCAIHWFNPAVWYAVSRLRSDQELACDELALSYTQPGESREYGETIVRLSRRFPASRQLPSATGILEDRSQVRARIQAITKFDYSIGRRKPLAIGLFAHIGLLTLTDANTTVPDKPFILSEQTTSGGMGIDRTVVFLDNQRVGTVLSRTVNPESQEVWRSLAEARGSVTVPAGVEASLSIDAEVSDLPFLRKLPQDLFYGFFFKSNSSETRDLSSIAHLTSLRRLELKYTGVTPQELSGLSGLTNLMHLDLEKCPLDDRSMVHVGEFSGLRFLNLNGTGISHRGLKHLAELSELEVLWLQHNAVTGDGFSSLANLTSLRELDLKEAGVHDGDLSYLTELPSIDRMDLRGCPITDSGLKHLSELKTLRFLNLGRTAITDAGLVHLKELPNLETLEVFGTAVTERGLSDWSLARPARDVGPNAPKVGIVFSHFTTTSRTFTGGDKYRGPMKYLRELEKEGADLYAIVEPSTEHLGHLPGLLGAHGLTNRTIDGTDPNALKSLDIILSTRNPKVRPEFIAAVGEAIRAGVGFVNVHGGFGQETPGYTENTKHVIGLQDARFTWMGRVEVPCRVATTHPILAGLGRGDEFWIMAPYGHAGKLEGTPLLHPPEGFAPDFCPLYVREVGEGRVVNCQWIGRSGLSSNQTDFYVRCINWAAGRPVEDSWIGA